MHAKWSVFFDYLQVPYAYEPMMFGADTGSAACTPAFWLPEQRLWFHAAESAPGWWERFACCAAADVEGRQWTGMFEEGWEGRCSPKDVSSSMSNEYAGMSTHNDGLYRWTLCQQCGLFGVEYGGFADRLVCGCLESHKDRSGSPLLLEAFRAAEVWAFGVSAGADEGPRAEDRHPVVRESLVDQEGMARASSLCMGTCFSLED